MPVQVRRGGKVVKRYKAKRREAHKTIRLRLGARSLPRGTYRVRITARRGGRTVTATLATRRL